MLLSQIFAIGKTYLDEKTGLAQRIRDIKIKQCEHIDLIDEPPFIKRCKNLKLSNLRVCKEHRNGDRVQ
jgi:hypothetical protein